MPPSPSSRPWLVCRVLWCAVRRAGRQIPIFSWYLSSVDTEGRLRKKEQEKLSTLLKCWGRAFPCVLYFVYNLIGPNNCCGANTRLPQDGKKAPFLFCALIRYRSTTVPRRQDLKLSLMTESGVPSFEASEVIASSGSITKNTSGLTVTTKTKLSVVQFILTD